MTRAIIRSVLASVLILGAAFAPPTPAIAQSPPGQSITLPAAASTAELKALTRTLQDPAARDRLVGELKALVAARRAESNANPAPPQPIGDVLIAFLSAQIRRMVATIMAAPGLAHGSALSELARRLTTDRALQLQFAEGLAALFGILVMAVTAERLSVALLGRARERSHASAPNGFGRVVAFVREIVLRWTPLLAFAAVGYGALVALTAYGVVQPAARAAAIAVLSAHVFAGAIVAVAGASLAPSPGAPGIAPLDEETANYWLIWIGRLTRLTVYGYFAYAFALDVGADPDAVQLVARLAGLALTGLLVMLALQNRAPVARALAGPESGPARRMVSRIRRRVANVWHWAAIAYLIAGYALWASGEPELFLFVIRASALSAIVVAAAAVASAVGVRLTRRLLTISPDLATRLPGLQKRVDRYAPVLIGVGRGLVNVVALAIIIKVWGLDPVGWLATPAGRRLLETLGVLALSIAISVAIWELAGLFIDVYLSRPGADGTPVQRGARMRTLLPLARRTLAIALACIVFVVLLSELGVNVGPLLAGAEIAGITIGLGAQSLVKDIINGMFILAQDAVAVGDVVSVAGSTGLVEELSIRSIRLRALDGTVIFVPFSEISTVRNLTKEYSYALFDIGVSYREDVDEVVRIVTALAEELRADPEFGWRILEPIEVLGLDQFADSAVIIKARIKTRPIKQWDVLREFNRRLKRRFDELGVEIPFPHRTVYFGVDKHGEAPRARISAEVAVAAAGKT